MATTKRPVNKRGHNLLLGTSNSYTGYGGIIGGLSDRTKNAYASVFDGSGNTASGYASAITGGSFNTASANYTTIGGGCSNLAGSGTLSVNAFCTNTTRSRGGWVVSNTGFVTEVCRLCADFGHGLEGREWQGRTEA